MKRILITGKTSYIGTSFASYIKDNPEYQVDTISVRGEDWKTQDFSVYDVVLHVAGIAHKKETKENQQEYFNVNYTLTKELGKKAKDEGVSQFIYLSSMSVYGVTEGVITKDTIPNPTSAYGKSKLEAEKYLETLQSDDFKVAIIRPPMVYGKNCPGNFAKLEKISRISFCFVDSNNQRSMIYIKNLSEYITIIMNNYNYGIMFPQNINYVNTFSIYETIRKTRLKKYVRISNRRIKSTNINILNKVFGDLVYDKQIDKIDMRSYNIVDFRESIEQSTGSETSVR